MSVTRGAKNGKEERTRARKKHGTLWYALWAAGLIALCALIYFAGRQIELRLYGNETVRGDLSAKTNERRIVTYEGKEYYYNPALLNILVMGIDQDTESLAAASDFRNGGQADFLMLIVIDSKEKTVTRLQIDRDTMAEITILGVFGNNAGTRTAQICLSHGFGDGGKQSCEYTKEAVEKLLLGVEVDFYVALNLDSIPVINDAVGGVTVLIEDDYTAYDPQMAPGRTMTLMGEQAEMFVRWRMNVGDGTNASRMRRQNTYLSKLTEAVRAKISENASYVGKLLDEIGDGILTDMRRGRMINEVNRAIGYDEMPPLSIAGEHTLGNTGYVEFHADENALAKLVIDTFYLPNT